MPINGRLPHSAQLYPFSLCRRCSPGMDAWHCGFPRSASSRSSRHQTSAPARRGPFPCCAAMKRAMHGGALKLRWPHLPDHRSVGVLNPRGEPVPRHRLYSDRCIRHDLVVRILVAALQPAEVHLDDPGLRLRLCDHRSPRRKMEILRGIEWTSWRRVICPIEPNQ